MSSWFAHLSIIGDALGTVGSSYAHVLITANCTCKLHELMLPASSDDRNFPLDRCELMRARSYDRKVEDELMLRAFSDHRKCMRDRWWLMRPSSYYRKLHAQAS